MSDDKLRIRVGLGENGKTPTWELMHHGVKVCDLSYTELIEHALQAVSSARWITEKR
ncbi:hypothetical protein [Mesorhizobium sp. ESP-6-2]|uniref:hypothetical protein n=1 Tax=Mesorhizobium sp. ESP-6-2 TaxID=2876625 RepID=UPI001CCB62F9|nr:hypothetical protein [Mesorhizobium sp. ESP-6-2]MBZ9807716.1 hypothetical protein [Mesorhizobium sp. ESP-6-2]